MGERITTERARELVGRRRCVRELLDLAEEASSQGVAGFGLLATAIDRGERVEPFIELLRRFVREDRERENENSFFRFRADLHERAIAILSALIINPARDPVSITADGGRNGI